MLLRKVLVAAAFLCLGSIAARAADLTISIQNLRNDQGTVLLCVFSAETSTLASFPDCEKGKPVRTAKLTIKGGKAVADFKGLKDGTYAIALIHDENGNGQLDTNFLGIPTEGIGVSNNPSLLGKPSYEESRFELKGKMSVTIETKYIL